MGVGVVHGLAAIADAGLANRWLMWLFTVACETTRCAAISALDRPRAMSPSTSASRAVSSSGSGAGDGPAIEVEQDH
jgi:hypothetical protein